MYTAISTSQHDTYYETMHKMILDEFIRVNYGIKQTHAMPQLYQNRCNK